MVRGKKMNLGEFLGERTTSYTPEVALPSGPRARDEDSGYGGGRGGGYGGDRRGGFEREPSRSEASDQWRGDRGPTSDRYGGDRGGSRFGSRNDEGGSWRGGGGSAGPSRYDRPSSRGGYDRESEERPAHMRLNLQRRAEGGADAAGSSSSRDDKFASAFGRRGGGDSGSRFGGSDDRYGRRDDRGYGGDRGGGRFDRRDYGDNEPDAGAFSNLRLNDRQEADKQVEQEASLSPEQDKKAKAAAMREERKRKAEEERKAAEEAKKKAAEEKKKQEETAKKKADADREIMKKVLSSGKTGEALAKVAKEQFKTGRPSGGVLFATVLAKAADVAKKSANWIAPEQYGPLLKAGMEDSTKASQVEAIYALQEFLNQHDFPKGVMEKCFMALYSFDIIDESAFFEYKYDVDSNVPGRVKAIIQVSNWLTWLETPEEESDEEDDDE